MLCSAHNITIKDLGREVQREMNASIASVARMIERLDLNSKHTGVSIPLSSSLRGTSNLSYKGKDMKECEITESPNEIVGKNVRGMSSVESSCVKSIIPGQSEASLVQVGRAVRFGTNGLAITFVSSASDYDVLNHVSDDIIVDMWSDLNED